MKLSVRAETKRRICLHFIAFCYGVVVKIEIPTEAGRGGEGVRKRRGRRFYRTDLSPWC